MKKSVALVEEIIIALLVFVIAVTSYYIFSDNRHIVYSEPSPLTHFNPMNMPEPSSPPPAAPLHVFQVSTESQPTKVVGYFAQGAFVADIPLWLSENWMTQKSVENTTVFTPREEVLDREFSDLVMITGNTSESHNAESLFEKNKAHARGEGKLVHSEIILNEAQDMRIFRVERSLDGWVYETYYVDGNGKTAEIKFGVTERNFFVSSSKVKEFVLGLSKGSAPRG